MSKQNVRTAKRLRLHWCPPCSERLPLSPLWIVIVACVYCCSLTRDGVSCQHFFSSRHRLSAPGYLGTTGLWGLHLPRYHTDDGINYTTRNLSGRCDFGRHVWGSTSQAKLSETFNLRKRIFAAKRLPLSDEIEACQRFFSDRRFWLTDIYIWARCSIEDPSTFPDRSLMTTFDSYDTLTFNCVRRSW